MKFGRKRKYATEEERKAAMKEYAAKYRALRKSGKWVRKNRILKGVPEESPVPTADTELKRDTPIEIKRIVWKLRKERSGPQAEVREEKKALVKEIYGFDLYSRSPDGDHEEFDAEELEGRARYGRMLESQTRFRQREKMRMYHREYRRKRRAAELEAKQKTWTAAEWEAYRRKLELKEKGPGTEQWFVDAVARQIASEDNLPVDAVMERIVDSGGLEFLLKGREAIGREDAASMTWVRAAANALRFFADPEFAVMYYYNRKPGGKRR